MNNNPRIRTVMLPKDTNAMGSIFGGVILSLIDQAAGEQARITAPGKFVTKIFREVNFIAPVQIGDTVSCYTEIIATGNTSITILVDVTAQNAFKKENPVTKAEVVMVAIDDQGRPETLASRELQSSSKNSEKIKLGFNLE